MGMRFANSVESLGPRLGDFGVSERWGREGFREEEDWDIGALCRGDVNYIREG